MSQQDKSIQHNAGQWSALGKKATYKQTRKNGYRRLREGGDKDSVFVSGPQAEKQIKTMTQMNKDEVTVAGHWPEWHECQKRPGHW